MKPELIIVPLGSRTVRCSEKSTSPPKIRSGTRGGMPSARARTTAAITTAENTTALNTRSRGGNWFIHLFFGRENTPGEGQNKGQKPRKQAARPRAAGPTRTGERSRRRRAGPQRSHHRVRPHGQQSSSQEFPL